jgi:tRNA(fMet)-specific endonuclease VapC
MRFLLDTNIVSAYLRNNGQIFNRIIQHSGGLAVSTICVGELYSWIYREKFSDRLTEALEDFLANVQLLPIDLDIARKFGQTRAALLDQGRPVPTLDLFIASTALHYDLTLVTHNIKDFASIQGLRIED